MSGIKDAYSYFLEEVWPQLVASRGLSADALPTDTDFTTWLSDETDWQQEINSERAYG